MLLVLAGVLLFDPSDMSGSQATDHGWQWHKDPRLCCLGFRGFFPSNTTRVTITCVAFLFLPLVEAEKKTDERNYLLWILEKGVAEGSTEIPKDLMEKVAPQAEVINTDSSKKVEAITTAIGSRGWGLLPLEDAFKGSDTLIIQGEKDVKVEVVRPEWWPTEWFQEHKQVSAAA